MYLLPNLPQIVQLEMSVGAALAVANEVAGLIPTHRQCSVEITNKCCKYVLSKPSVHIVSGVCAEPLPPHIGPRSSGKALFTKTPHAARGSVGVFTYDLLDQPTKKPTVKVAVMFSVPYDFNLYSNWFAVGIFNTCTECNYDLYYKMYNNTGQTFRRRKADGKTLTHKGCDVTVMATMSNSYQPVMKVEVTDD
ncbi:bryoporin-like [Sphaeramia orbicularis]|uniref:bryoporin-like n=1 Tax=Sphaeramia orbicularis TaxID=375764 RepID=UPI00117EF24C|nr:bryoporin-like [Sphaeramia orbicularis]